MRVLSRYFSERRGKMAPENLFPEDFERETTKCFASVNTWNSRFCFTRLRILVAIRTRELLFPSQACTSSLDRQSALCAEISTKFRLRNLTCLLPSALQSLFELTFNTRAFLPALHAQRLAFQTHVCFEYFAFYLRVFSLNYFYFLSCLVACS